MTLPGKVDVLVVGAGPAGCTAALHASRHGARTLLIDRKVQVGVPVRCGEYIPKMLLMELPPVASCIAQETPHLVLHLPDSTTHALRAPGVVIHRDRLDRLLASRAQEAGAVLATSTRFLHLDHARHAILMGDGMRVVSTQVIIGADGPHSRVARATDLPATEHMLAMQQVVRLARKVQNAHIYFWNTPLYGYGWLFPKDDMANLGVAVRWRHPHLARQALTELREILTREHTIDAGPPIRRVTGLVPSAGPLERTATGHVILAGDAAGHVDALTGAGIASATRAGRIAGRTAATASAEDLPGTYEKSWSKVLGRSLARSVSRRDVLREGWDDDLTGAVREAWLGQ